MSLVPVIPVLPGGRPVFRYRPALHARDLSWLLQYHIQQEKRHQKSLPGGWFNPFKMGGLNPHAAGMSLLLPAHVPQQVTFRSSLYLIF